MIISDFFSCQEKWVSHIVCVYKSQVESHVEMLISTHDYLFIIYKCNRASTHSFVASFKSIDPQNSNTQTSSVPIHFPFNWHSSIIFETAMSWTMCFYFVINRTSTPHLNLVLMTQNNFRTCLILKFRDRFYVYYCISFRSESVKQFTNINVII